MKPPHSEQKENKKGERTAEEVLLPGKNPSKIIPTLSAACAKRIKLSYN